MNHEAESSGEGLSDDPADRVIRYHLRTKHHFNRYARSLGFLDWVNQPDPFRRFEGAHFQPLPLLKPDDDPVSPSYGAIYEPSAVPGRPIDLRTLSRFFEFSLALSAWKKAGESEWALRSNPSSGNLHPTEGYIGLSSVEGLAVGPGLYHYAPKEHGLECRIEWPARLIETLLSPFPRGAFLFGLTSIHWREEWKYGERAFRYCNHDVGHALGAVRIAAATLGWAMMLLDGIDQNTAAILLGTHRSEDFLNAEPEHPDCLAVVWAKQDVTRETSFVERELERVPLFLDSKVVKDLAAGSWCGKANRLSREHGVHWDIIDETAAASWKNQADPSTTASALGDQPPHVPQLTLHESPSAGRIIRQRRSAVAFDGKTSIAAPTFYRMLSRTMTHPLLSQLDRPVPWDLWPYDPSIHLLLFVHRVDGLTPGVYFLVRDPRKLELIQQSTSAELTWTKVLGSPDDLPLYWLLEGDAKRLATQVSCHQEIAGDSAFSFGMVAEFEAPLRKQGAWWYPRMYWESGILGQILYVEAEVHGLRATGIGCFFDDPVHEIIAIKGLTFQSLYHFTIGGAVEDPRLQTLPAYAHINR
jgi:SagB-type dehydrogenase family enzyme